MAWDGASVRMLIAGLMMSLGGTIVASLNRGVLHASDEKPPEPEPPPVQPPPVQMVRR